MALVPDGYKIKQLEDKIRILENNNKKEFFEWKPYFNCISPDAPPTVNYTQRRGRGCKIKIKDNLSIVFIELNLRGSITAVNGKTNYAYISGIPYTNSLESSRPSFNFSMFYKGVSMEHPSPLGFIENKTIRVQSGNSHGGGAEQWQVCNDFEISGSGFYFTNQ